MPIVNLPDGRRLNFPDGTPPAEMSRAIDGLFAQSKPSAQEGPSKLESFGRGAVQGGTLGFGDEIGGAFKAGTRAISRGIEGAVYGDNVLPDVGYSQSRDAIRSANKSAQEANPGSYFGGEVAGSLASGTPGGAALTAGNGVLRAAKLGAVGAGYGGVAGAGYSEGDAGQTLKDTGQGAALGGFLGGVGLPVAGAVAGRVGKGLKNALALGDKPNNAQSMLIDRLQKDKVDLTGLRDALTATDKPVAIVDIGGANTKGLASAIANKPGAAKSAAEDFLNKRQEGQSSRLSQDIGENISQNKDFYGTLDDIIARRKELSKPLYEEAYKAGNVTSDKIDTLIKESADIQGALRQARRLPEYKGLADNDIRLLDKAYKNIGGKAQAARQKGDAERARDFDSLRISLQQAIVEKVPAYGKALETFSSESASKDALEAGKEFFKNPPELIKKELSSLSEGDRELYRSGAARKLQEMMSATADGADEVKRIFGNDLKKSQIGALFDKETDFNRFADRMKQEASMYDSRTKVLSGSRTTPLAEEQKQLASDSLSLLGKVGRGQFLSAAGQVIGDVGGRLAGRNEKVNAELAKYLFNSDVKKSKQLVDILLQRNVKNIKSDERARRLGNVLGAGAGQASGGSTSN